MATPLPTKPLPARPPPSASCARRSWRTTPGFATSSAVDGTDGKVYYIALSPRSELEQYPTGTVVEVKGGTAVRTDDRNIAEKNPEISWKFDLLTELLFPLHREGNSPVVGGFPQRRPPATGAARAARLAWCPVTSIVRNLDAARKDV
ncbi:DUF3363 domain-containing protein [Paraburkholderia dinghuensis]|uniref:DUF3363 domain-containing protein n=1 Tax=Paraburkholderia dinghuensis TaxID=2305225 RepID=A0A3N6MS34_9BURK|nr:DUF3363 domain-containing protein [Paraburkholderia dinghuensis]